MSVSPSSSPTVGPLTPGEQFHAALDDDPVLQRMKSARRVLVLTGAGISAPSGVPTFRGPDGIYTNADVEPPVHISDLVERPEEVAAWHGELHEMTLAAEPNDGHRALAETQALLRAKGGELTVVTMNVDDLHERAGAEVFHLHGRLDREFCGSCDVEREALHRADPCECGGQFRSGPVLFGELLDAEASRAGRRALDEADVMYVVGASGATGTCWSWVQTAKHLQGAVTVLITIDPDPAWADLFDVVVGDSAANLAQYLPDPGPDFRT